MTRQALCERFVLAVAILVGVLAALPVALLLALGVYTQTLWAVARLLGRAPVGAMGLLRKQHWSLLDDPAAPAILTFPRR